MAKTLRQSIRDNMQLALRMPEPPAPQMVTPAPSLAERFKAEFLQPVALDDVGMREALRRYRAQGLRARDAKAVVQDLIANHGFVVVADKAV